MVSITTNQENIYDEKLFLEDDEDIDKDIESHDVPSDDTDRNPQSTYFKLSLKSEYFHLVFAENMRLRYEIALRERKILGNITLNNLFEKITFPKLLIRGI